MIYSSLSTCSGCSFINRYASMKIHNWYAYIVILSNNPSNSGRGTKCRRVSKPQLFKYNTLLWKKQSFYLLPLRVCSVKNIVITMCFSPAGYQIRDILDGMLRPASEPCSTHNPQAISAGLALRHEICHTILIFLTWLPVSPRLHLAGWRA